MPNSSKGPMPTVPAALVRRKMFPFDRDARALEIMNVAVALPATTGEMITMYDPVVVTAAYVDGSVWAAPVVETMDT